VLEFLDAEFMQSLWVRRELRPSKSYLGMRTPPLSIVRNHRVSPWRKLPCVRYRDNLASSATCIDLFTRQTLPGTQNSEQHLGAALIHALRTGERLIFQAADRIGQNALYVVNLSLNAIDHMDRAPCGRYVIPAADRDASCYL